MITILTTNVLNIVVYRCVCVVEKMTDEELVRLQKSVLPNQMQVIRATAIDITGIYLEVFVYDSNDQCVAQGATVEAVLEKLRNRGYYDIFIRYHMG